jgi:hypothetical protein
MQQAWYKAMQQTWYEAMQQAWYAAMQQAWYQDLGCGLRYMARLATSRLIGMIDDQDQPGPGTWVIIILA